MAKNWGVVIPLQNRGLKGRMKKDKTSIDSRFGSISMDTFPPSLHHSLVPMSCGGRHTCNMDPRHDFFRTCYWLISRLISWSLIVQLYRRSWLTGRAPTSIPPSPSSTLTSASAWPRSAGWLSLVGGHGLLTMPFFRHTYMYVCIGYMKIDIENYRKFIYLFTFSNKQRFGSGSTAFGRIRIHFNPRSGSGSTSISFLGSGSGST